MLLEVNNLSISFINDGSPLSVVSDVSFNVGKGEIVALVGESGCGKSVTCMALTRLLPEKTALYPSGKITFRSNGQEYSVLDMPTRQLRSLRGGKIGYIFQEPSVSLNPVYRVGDQIAESINLHNPKETDVKGRIIELLSSVGIPDPPTRLRCYPHELSGGMQQRVMIAMALAGNPELLIADEPTTALDVTIQAQILELLADLRKTRDMSIILVTHNLGVVSEMADRVIVMYAGHTVEAGNTAALLEKPLHPYSSALLDAVPVLGNDNKSLLTIPGTVPAPSEFPPGCRFAGRCSIKAGLSPDKQRQCEEQLPPWENFSGDRYCRCFHPLIESKSKVVI
jgi:peptide/nickel transport system ATP-binding protein